MDFCKVNLGVQGMVMFLSISLIGANYYGSFFMPSNENNFNQGPTPKLNLIYSWKSLEFDYPNEEARKEAIHKEEFIEGAPVPIDVDFSRVSTTGQKLFVSVPRFQNGVPVTLGHVSKNSSRHGNPIIVPYPSWEMNKVGNCDHITSVYRMKIDECDRLWVLDTGKIIEEQVCPPQLLAFDLHTDKMIVRHKFPKDQIKADSLFITPTVDIRDPKPAGQCYDTHVYIADVGGFQLIVFNYMTKTSWNIKNNLFYPYPPQGTFTIDGTSFDLMDGIFGLALSPILPNNDRTLYFHSLASVVESFVSTSVIRNYSLFHENPEASPRSFKSFQKERPSQSAAQGMSKAGVMFYGLMTETALGCWNSMKYPDFGGRNLEILVKDKDTLQFASGLKVTEFENGREAVWVITVSFQKVMAGTMKPDETNFRIQAGYVDELIRGSKCDVQSSSLLTPSRRPMGFHGHHHGYFP